MASYKDENDSYLKKGMKDESEKAHMPGKKLMKTIHSKKKTALKSALGSLGSGANFKN
jgi:hypothetical protein